MGGIEVTENAMKGLNRGRIACQMEEGMRSSWGTEQGRRKFERQKKG